MHQAAALHSLLHEARSEAVMMMMILVLQLLRAAVACRWCGRKMRWQAAPIVGGRWLQHTEVDPDGDHDFLTRLWRPAAWSFLLRGGRQVHLPHQPLRRYSACRRRLQQL